MTVPRGMPSRTSILVAAARALGTREPDESVRNADVLAAQFIGPEELALIHDHSLSRILDLDYAEAVQSLEIFELVLMMLIRTRIFDEIFENALSEGFDEFVILGAGFDSRAYRFADRLAARRVVEIDSPDTQEWKKRRVQSALGGLPPHVTYVPADFARDRLEDVLLAAGHNRNQRSFYVAEGLTMYLTETTIRQTLQTIAVHSAPGSRMAIEYVTSGAIQFTQKFPSGAIKSALGWGEPWIFGVPDNRDQEFFSETGMELERRQSLMSADTAKKYAYRKDGTFYGAHMMEAFKARAELAASMLSPADMALAARFGYWIAELRVPAASGR